MFSFIGALSIFIEWRTSHSLSIGHASRILRRRRSQGVTNCRRSLEILWNLSD
jgi:hypothetical protein